MKKLNVKKFNQFMMNLNNSQELRDLVNDAVIAFTNASSTETTTLSKIAILEDLNLLVEIPA